MHYVQNLQNYAAFNQGNLTFSRYQNLSNANTVSVNTLSYSKCSKCLPPAFTYSLNLFLKLGTALFCGKFSHVFSGVTQFRNCIWLRMKLSKSFVHRSPDICGDTNLERWPLFLLNNLQTVHVQALLSDTCCVPRRAPCV